ncbi:MAG: penicillin-binding protein 1A [Proteobacteria bacterium]|nr:penicillin-binding protein 1A [Pseudomonadota bacterium]
MKRFFVFLMTCLFTLALIGSVIGYLIFSYYTQDLPDYKQLETYDPPIVTRLYANDGRLFHEYAKEKRVFLPIAQIPQHIINTFLAAEDKNFYNHQGIDASSILRAFLSNIRNFLQGKRPQGASTITQQVAKNFLVGNEMSLARKIKEAILAFRLEKTFSKEKILELYLNEIYLGGAYGIGAASVHYFNKSLDELSIPEAAYLAALPKAPNSYHPIKHAEKAIARRNWVIDRMVENGIITFAQGEQAKKEPLSTNFHNTESGIVTADFFAEEVRRDIVSRFGLNELYKGGLTVKTTLDPKLQSIADEVLRKAFITYDRRYGWRGPFANISIENWQDALKNFKRPRGLSPFQLAVVLETTKESVLIGLKDGTTGKIPLKELLWARPHLITKEGHPYVGPLVKKPSDVLKIGDIIAVSPLGDNLFSLQQIPEVGGALVAMDPHTGKVLAMIGGYSFEKSEFNRATQALRQPGSTFKVFAYLSGLEKGLSSTTQIMDAPVEIDIGWGLGKWSPKNISKKFYGKVTLRRAFERSYNASTVQLAKVLGIQEIVNCAIRFGAYEHLAPQWAMVLGTGETTLLKLTTAFSTIANGGKKVTPVFIERIQDRRGKTIYKSDTRSLLPSLPDQVIPSLLEDLRVRVADEATIYQIISLLEGTVERGTGKRAKVEGYSIAGKSGTSSDFRDAWFIGFTPNLVVGIFMGFDSGKSLGNHEEGGKLAAPIFGDFMKQALKGQPSIPFKRPSGLKFKRVNLDTGEPTSLKDKNAIVEGFKPGTDAIDAQTSSIAIGQPGYKLPSASSDITFFNAIENLLTDKKEEKTLDENMQMDQDIQKQLPQEEEIALPENFLEETSSEEEEDVPMSPTNSSETPYTIIPLDPIPPLPPSSSEKKSETLGTGTGGLF